VRKTKGLDCILGKKKTEAKGETKMRRKKPRVVQKRERETEQEE